METHHKNLRFGSFVSPTQTFRRWFIGLPALYASLAHQSKGRFGHWPWTGDSSMRVMGKKTATIPRALREFTTKVKPGSWGDEVEYGECQRAREIALGKQAMN